MAINPTQGIGQPQHQAVPEQRASKGSSVEQHEVPKVVAAPKEATSVDSRKTESAHQEARVKEATQLLNDFMRRVSLELHFSIDSDTGQTVVKVVSRQTGELIRQIPSEEALKLAKSMDTGQGVIIQRRA